MTKRRFSPASIVDELACCIENSHSNFHLVYAWIFTLEGAVHTDVVQMALDKTFEHYPKCKCILTNNYPSFKRWFRYRWEYTEFTGKDIVQEIELSNPDFNIEQAVNYYVYNHHSLAIDLSSHIPIKVLLIRQPQRTFLFFIMHHAVGDGIGSFSFIQKFMVCYEEIFYQRKTVNSGDGRFEDISLPDIRFRWNRFSLDRLRPFFRYYRLLRKEPPVRLYLDEPPLDPGEFYACIRSIGSQPLEAIRALARKYGATINDYLLAAAFKTIKKWARGWMGQSERIYIMVPVNLRPPEDQTLSNNLSSVSVSLKPACIGEINELLPMIRDQIAELRKNFIAQTLSNLPCFLKLIPIPLRSPLLKRANPDLCPTLLLSNLGTLNPNLAHQDEEGFHYLGPARISNIHVIPNAGKWPDLLVSTYNNQMVITIAVLSSCFSPKEAERFMDAYVCEAIE